MELEFEELTLELYPDSVRQYRADGLHYYLRSHVFPFDDTTARYQALEPFAKVHAESAPPWCSLLHQPLEGIEMEGPQGFPQSVRLAFPEHEVVIAVGYGDGPIVVGDHDELLIFHGARADGRWSGQPPDWVTLWKV